MYDSFTTPAEKQKYLDSLHNMNRVSGADIIVQYTTGRRVVNHANVLCGSGITFESSSTGTNVFNLGGANVDTAQLEMLYNGAECAAGFEDVKEDLTFIELRCGYGTRPYRELPSHDDGDIVTVPLNIYTIQSKSSKIGENKYIIKLQSLMSKLDQNLPAVFDISSYMADRIAELGLDGPTPLIILEWIAKMCDLKGTPSTTIIPMEVSDKMYDSSFTAKLANWDKIFNITNNSGYTTYRDIVKDLAAVCGGFATFVYEGIWMYYDNTGSYEGHVSNVPSRLAILPYCPYDSDPYYLNNGDTDFTPVTDAEEDMLIKYAEALDAFKVEEIKYRAVEKTESEGTTTETEVNYDCPGIERDFDWDYDISELKILDCLYVDTELPDADKAAIYRSVSREIYDHIGYVTLNSSGAQTNVPLYQPIPYDITTTAPDFRFQIGDWAQVKSRFLAKGSAEYLGAIGQIMRISWKTRGTCSYKSFNSPSANDRNSSWRSSYADDGTPAGEGGTVPPGPEPEPPVIILDSEGQWLFGDEAELIDEAEAMARPGEIVHLSVAGQWNFGGSI